VTLEDLRVFVAVCRLGSLSEVARQLACTQPAVSQHVARLERELGVALLERRPTGVVPTEMGEALFQSAADGLDTITSGVRRVAEIRDGGSGSLAITTGGTTVRHFLRGAVARFRDRFPDVALQFVPGRSTASCLEALRQDQADLALVTISEPLRGIEQRPVATQELRALVRADGPLGRRRRVSIRDLRDRPYIGLSAETHSHSYIQRVFREHGVELRATLSVDDFDTASVFVELGLGYAIVPAVQAWNFSRDARLRSLAIEGTEPIPIGWAARRWASLSGVAISFVEGFHDEMARLTRVPGLELLDPGTRGAGRGY
jgi:DNA-binding transcriptional LysR family regulator